MTPKLGLLKQVGCSCILTLRTMFRFWRYSNRHVRTWLPTLTFPVFVYTYLLIVFTVLLVCLWLCSSLVQEQRNCRQNVNMYTGTPCLLCFAILCFVVCVCYKLKTCGHPVISHFISATFPTAFAHFLSLCPILVILAIFQTFFITVIFVMVFVIRIFDVPIITALDTRVFFLLHWQLFPHLSPSPCASRCPETKRDWN